MPESSDLESPEYCQAKAKECETMAETMTNPTQKEMMGRYVEYWFRLAEYYKSRGG